MNLTDNLLGESWYWAAWLVWLPLFARSVWLAPWRRLADPGCSNLWLGMIVMLIVLWSLKAGVKPGLSLHLLGANLFALAFGPHLAFIGLSLVVLGDTFNAASANYFALAANALLLAGVGVGLSQLLFRFFSNLLPRHFFVYVFVNGFLAAALVMVAVGLASTLLLVFSGVYPLDYLLEEYFPYYFLLAFSEAWLSGMVITLLIVYRPAWVASFDDALYLTGK